MCTGKQRLKIDVEHLFFKFWEELPQPKPDYTQWFYGKRIHCTSFRDNLTQIWDSLGKEREAINVG